MQTEYDNETAAKSTQTQDSDQRVPHQAENQAAGETGGLDPTRYGDWEKNGRCIDF